MSADSVEMNVDQKRQLVAKLLRDQARRQIVTCPLSYGQQSLWFIHQLDPHSSAYNVMYAARLRSDVDRPALGRAFETLLERHAALRTTFGAENGEPVQKIHAHLPFELPWIEAADWSDDRLQQTIQDEADEPFDLEQGPVIRAQVFDRGSHPHVLLVTAHHVAVDFWSFDLMFEQLDACYRAETTGVKLDYSPPKVEYTDYVQWQREWLACPEGQRQWEYWQQELGGELPELDLPTDRQRQPVQTFAGESLRFEVPDTLSASLQSLAKSNGATLFATLLAAFEVLLYRYTGQRDLLVGSPTAGRSRAELEEVLGYFLNPVVFRGRIDPEQSFDQFLAQVRQTVIDGVSNQDYPFPLLVERLHPPRVASRSPIFQVAFGWDQPRKGTTASGESTTAESNAATGLGLEPFALGQQGSAFDLMLMMLDLRGSLSASLQYNSDLFDASTIERFIEHFLVLLEDIVRDPTRPIADLALLSGSERRRLVDEFNDTAAEYPRDQCVHELFAEQVRRDSGRVAVICGEERLTYEELNRRANALANHLIRLGVGPNVPVGLFVERSAEMLVAVLGVLKSGGAYVPLAPGTPDDRLRYMLDETQAPVVITQDELLEQLPQTPARIVCLGRDDAELAECGTDDPPRRAVPEDLAYVIFTSGSTGRPKGVQIEQRNLVNLLSSMRREPGIDRDDTLLAVTTLSFDISMLELLLPLVSGARVEVVPRDVICDGVRLAQLVVDSRATIMQGTPATWRLLIEAGWNGDQRIKVLSGGEALPRDLAEALLQRSGELWNMYGPTETTIWSAIERIDAIDGPVSLGKPIANTQIYLLDERHAPVPIGVAGELMIGGDGLARGYLNRPDLTAERFIPNPFADTNSERLYRTGDLARLRPDGRLDFLGRLDFQVKVRGYRIELGEIESHLDDHPAIRQSVVVARQAGEQIDDKQLVAYLVPADVTVPNTGQLRDHLKQRLPDYMVPSVFVSLETFPLNPAGKVDRKALPEPSHSRPEMRREYIAPGDALEKALADMWADVLSVDRVGVEDNYFDLGGASIQSLELASKTTAAGYEMNPALLFQHPTVRDLAGALRRAAESRTETPDPRSVIDTPTAETPTVPQEDAPEKEAPSFVASETRPSSPKTRSVATGPPKAGVPTRKNNTLIESIGVYLPPREVSTKEVLKGCTNRVWFPLETMTGIKSRRMAGEDEFTIHLAIKAAQECLAHSRYDAGEIDLVVCCNITRSDEHFKITVEPSTSIQLARSVGFTNATVIDITNACSGMFTAIAIVEAFIQSGAIRRGMVVSGEYTTHITTTAQQEITTFVDSRLACLTVGDAGAAVVLEAAEGKDVGFHELEMYTLAKYSRMCIGTITEEPHGGAILIVPDPMEHTQVAIKHSVAHAAQTFQRNPWPPEETDLLVMHQTSDRSIRDGMRSINKAFGKKICHSGNTLNNLAHRGNTASTTHFVALWDNILSGQVKSGDQVVFGITGSGQTIGTGIYTFDDLPDRLRRSQESGQPPERLDHKRTARPTAPNLPRVAIESVGTLDPTTPHREETPQLAAAAGNACLRHSSYDRREIGLLLFSGMLRTGYVCEPAIATMIAEEMKMNEYVEVTDPYKTFAFDVYNGALGTLNACEVAVRMIQAGTCRTAMVVASETEVNRKYFPDDPLGVTETASAMTLDISPDGHRGFGQFVYKYLTDHLTARTATGSYRDGKPFCEFNVDPRIDDYYLEAIEPAVEELLSSEGITIDRVTAVLPPQYSGEFCQRLAERIGVSSETVVDLSEIDGDLFTSSLAYSIQALQSRKKLGRGDVALIINVASGVQVGCTLYYY